jgi:hypothetical protein
MTAPLAYDKKNEMPVKDFRILDGNSYARCEDK